MDIIVILGGAALFPVGVYTLYAFSYIMYYSTATLTELKQRQFYDNIYIENGMGPPRWQQKLIQELIKNFDE